MAFPSVITEPDDESETHTNQSARRTESSSSRTTAPSLSDLLLGHPSHVASPSSPSLSATGTLSNNDTTVDGWPFLANLIAETPDFEAFPRFRELNIKTLLYYQVELAYLEGKLKNIEQIDFMKMGQDSDRYSRRADKLIQCQDEPSNPKSHKQWKMVLRIRNVLKEYSMAYK
jgi:hypothetical protein